MDIEIKKSIFRKKALKHYYDNLEYYRNYYVINKERLLLYSKEYRKKHNKIKFDTENISKKNRDLQIQYGNFTVNFD